MPRISATQKKNQVTSYAQMWELLGIDEAPKQPRFKPDFPKVMTLDGPMYAKDAMLKAGFACDNHMPNGTGAFGTGTVNLNQINGLALDNVFLGWGELSLLQQNCLITNICNIMADSMTDKWVKLKPTKAAKEDKKTKIEELEKHARKFDVKGKMNMALKKTMLLGTTYISPKLKNDDNDLQMPLSLTNAKIGKGDLEDIYIIEPTWVVPIEFNMINPRSPNFYKPEKYVVFGETLHASRMHRIMFIEPVNLLSPMYLFGGIPPIQQILPYILDFLNSKKQVVQIISRYNTSVLKTNLNTLRGQDSYAKATTITGNTKGRLAAFNALRNNFGVFALDKDEDFIQIQMNLTGLTDILQQQAEFLSLFTRIPVSKLFGQAPRGMNATGEYDANQYNDLIHSEQDSKLRPVIDFIYKLLMLDLWGEVDEEIEFEFVPLGELNESAQSALKNDKVNRAKNLVDGGMADPIGMMNVLVQDPELEFEGYERVEEPEPLDEDEDNVI